MCRLVCWLAGERGVPYHNAVHGADVVQTCFWFCNTGGVVRLIGAGATDFFCMVRRGGARARKGRLCADSYAGRLAGCGLLFAPRL